MGQMSSKRIIDIAENCESSSSGFASHGSFEKEEHEMENVLELNNPLVVVVVVGTQQTQLTAVADEFPTE